jgi:hypothetical protein
LLFFLIYDLRLFLIRRFLLLFVIFIADYITKYLLQRFKPHAEERPKFTEAIDIFRIVVLFPVNQMTQKTLSETVTVVSEWVILVTQPKIAKGSHYIINLVFIIVSDSYWDTLFESEPSTVTCLNHNNA